MQHYALPTSIFLISSRTYVIEYTEYFRRVSSCFLLIQPGCLQVCYYLYLSHSHIYCIIILFSEISKEKQHRAYGYSEVNDQIYSEIDSDPYDGVEDGNSIGVETNPAYKPIDELPLSQNRSRQAQVPLSLVIVNESVAVSETPMDGEGVEEKEQRAESRVEEEEADVTYYTPMNTGEVEEGEMSMQSRAVLKETEHDSMNMAEGALLQAFHGLG